MQRHHIAQQHRHINIKPIITALAVTMLIFATTVIIGKILIPFIVALILAYIVNPVVSTLDKKFKIKREISAIVVVLLVVIVLLAIPIYVFPALINQFKIIFEKIPVLLDVINVHVIAPVYMMFGVEDTLDVAHITSILLNHQKDLINNIHFFSPIATNGLIIAKIILGILLTPFVLFYAIVKWELIIKFFDDMIPRGYVKTVHQIVQDIDAMLSSYLRGQFAVMLVMSSYYAIGLGLVGVPFGIIAGIITGFIVFVPYLGVLTGLLVTLALSFAQFNGMHQIIEVLIVFIIGHILEGAIVTPFLIGHRIGLNPVLIILALMIFAKLFGFIGILLALPLAAITTVLLKHLFHYYRSSDYYQTL